MSRNKFGAAYKSALKKKIKSVKLDDDALVLSFADGTAIKFWDNGQSCCENRYMRTDDDLKYFRGATFRGAEIKPAPDVYDGDWYTHEVQFLEIHTSKGDFTMSSHVEHNGYYGGFSIVVQEVKP